jgi:hypothetical protein
MSVVAHVSARIKANQVIIHSQSDEDAPIPPDNLSADHFFNLNQSPHRRRNFRSQFVDRTIISKLDTETSDLPSLMTKTGVFSAVPNNPLSFTITIPHDSQSSLFGSANRIMH